MKKNINLVQFINNLIFIAAYALHSYTDAIYESRKLDSGMLGILKYVFLMAGIAFCIIQIQYKKSKILYVYELKKIGLVIWVIALTSFIFALFRGQFTTETIAELMKMALPVIYVFCIINTFSFKGIYRCMIAVLVSSIIGYVLEVGLSTFTLANIKSISFTASYSPFESHYAAGISIAMCAFFSFYRKNKILLFISLLFAIFTFKRFAIIFAIVLFVYPILFKTNKYISKHFITFLKIFFITATIGYYVLLTSNVEAFFESIFHMDAATFTMGRSGFLNNILTAGYTSFGLGSSTVYMGRNLEMDLIRIMLEVSVVGLIFFVWNYFDLARRHLYCTMYMTFSFFNMLTSHSLTNQFYWTLVLLTLGCILYKDNHHVSYLHNKKKKETQAKLIEITK